MSDYNSYMSDYTSYINNILTKRGENIVKPAIMNGKELKGYFVSRCGSVWSDKRSPFTKLTPNTTGSPYPRCRMWIDNKTQFVYVHRLVCETYVEFPIPEGVTKEEWDQTPDVIKKLVKRLYHVHHIDHNPGNPHVSNLEWVTAKQNSQKYHEFVKSS